MMLVHEDSSLEDHIKELNSKKMFDRDLDRLVKSKNWYDRKILALSEVILSRNNDI